MAKEKTEAPATTEQPAKEQKLVIQPPNFKRAVFQLVGVSPLVQCAFSAKVQAAIRDAQVEGSRQTKKRKGDKAPKDFRQLFLDSLHVSTEGWYGHPASAFRQAMISACRVGGIAMTLSKLAIFVDGDGFDRVSGFPLVRIHGSEPEYFEAPVRLRKAGSFDIRGRPMFREWRMNLVVRFDADVFQIQDIANLLSRAGLQVGIGEGRNDSRDSAGCGWGGFTFKNPAEAGKEVA